MELTLHTTEKLTPTVRAYTFQPATPLLFKPGQFVLLKRPGDEEKNARAFSLASPPSANLITFLMKHLPAGIISGYLSDAAPGTKLECSEAKGRFIPDPTDSERVFVVTGTGLAPIISYAEEKIPATTLFGVHDVEDIFWADRLANPLITVSQPHQHWTGAVGRVNVHLEKLIKKHPGAGWYLCGNPEMVKAIRLALLSADIPAAKIHFEIY